MEPPDLGRMFQQLLSGSLGEVTVTITDLKGCRKRWPPLLAHVQTLGCNWCPQPELISPDSDESEEKKEKK